MQVNARKIYGEPNVLEGLFDNKLFGYILAGELALQVRLSHLFHPVLWLSSTCCIDLLAKNTNRRCVVQPCFACKPGSPATRADLPSAEPCLVSPQVLIVQFGGEAFGTRPLTLPQWGACLGFGALGLLVRRGLLLFGGGQQTDAQS